MNRRQRWVFLILTLSLSTGCRQIEKLIKVSKPALPSARDMQEFDEQASWLQQRLMDRHLENGYVVSRRGESMAEEGDSLLFTGLALAALPCDRGRLIFSSIRASAEKRDGAFLRFDPLPDEYSDDPTSRDMETGILFGLITYHKRCQDSEVISLLKTHYKFIQKNSGFLYPNGDPTKININPSFQFLLNLYSNKLLSTPSPDDVDQTVYESALISNVTFIKSSEAPCYPVHLSTLQLISLATLKRPVSIANNKTFCTMTDGLDLALTDWYCHRLDPADWLRQWQETGHTYLHQRCPAWESTNTTMETPGLDFLLLYQLARNPESAPAL